MPSLLVASVKAVFGLSEKRVSMADNSIALGGLSQSSKHHLLEIDGLIDGTYDVVGIKLS